MGRQQVLRPEEGEEEMKGRDRIAPWAVAFLVIFLAVYCAMMAEGFTHTAARWWRQRPQTEESE